jgi:hypothetical protein
MWFYLQKDIMASASLTTSDVTYQGVEVEIKAKVPAGLIIRGNQYIIPPPQKADNPEERGRALAQLTVSQILVCYRTMQVYHNGDGNITPQYNAIAASVKRWADVIPEVDLMMMRDAYTTGKGERDVAHLMPPEMYLTQLLMPSQLETFHSLSLTIMQSFTDDNGAMNPPMTIAGDAIAKTACLMIGLPINNDKLKAYQRPSEFDATAAPQDSAFTRGQDSVKVRCEVTSSLLGTPGKRVFSQGFGEIQGGIMITKEVLDKFIYEPRPMGNESKPFHELSRSQTCQMSNILFGYMRGRQLRNDTGLPDLKRIYAVVAIPNIIASLYAAKLVALKTKLTYDGQDPIILSMLNLPARVSDSILNATRSDPSSLAPLRATDTVFDFAPVKYDEGRLLLNYDVISGLPPRNTVASKPMVWETTGRPDVVTTLYPGSRNGYKVSMAPPSTVKSTNHARSREYTTAQVWAMVPPRLAYSETILMEGPRAVEERTGILGRSTFFGARSPDWLRETRFKSCITSEPSVPWHLEQQSTPVSYKESAQRLCRSTCGIRPELSGPDAALWSLFGMVQDLSETATQSATKIAYPSCDGDTVRRAFAAGRATQQLDRPCWISEPTQQAAHLHGVGLCTENETAAIAWLSGNLTREMNQRAVNQEASHEKFFWVPPSAESFADMLAAVNTLHHIEGPMAISRRTMQYNMLVAKTVISMETRSAHSGHLASFSTGENWAVIRCPNPGPIDQGPGTAKYLPKTRYIWMHADEDEARTRAPHGFMRSAIRVKQGLCGSDASEYIPMLFRIVELNEPQINSIINAPIRNYVTVALTVQLNRDVYPLSTTEMGALEPCAGTDILCASLIYESRMGQYVGDTLQFAARFSGGSSNTWKTAKSTYETYKGNPFAGPAMLIAMCIQDKYQISTDITSAFMKIKMFAGSEKENTARTMDLSTGEEFQKRLSHELSHNDGGDWNVNDGIKAMMDAM